MNPIFLKKSLLSISLCFTLLLSVKAQETAPESNGGGKTEVYLDKLPDIKIEKLVFYQNPLFIEYEKLTDDYVPEWYPAYCANGYFAYFKDYAHEAVKYFHSISGITTEQLSIPIKVIKEKSLTLQDLYPNPYEYMFGEIWFTYQETKERIVLVMGYVPPSKVDNVNFGDINSTGKISSDNPFKDLGNITMPFIYEDNLLKLANQPYVFDEVLKSKSVIWKGVVFDDFSVLLKNASTYTRSRLVNGHRIFETVKNTPNGPVVVGGSEGKAWYQRYWWAIAGGLLALVALSYFILRRRKK